MKFYFGFDKSSNDPINLLNASGGIDAAAASEHSAATIASRKLAHNRKGQAMNKQASSSEYLVISRGQWDTNVSQQEIQNAIDQFYVWLNRLVDEGKMKPGQRLGGEGRTVSRKKIATDGPYGEAKEVIGGYWFIVAGSLDEAAEIAAGNPCLKCGLFYEIRPIDPERASAFTVTTETPSEHRDR
jgi:hypothetical protein